MEIGTENNSKRMRKRGKSRETEKVRTFHYETADKANRDHFGCCFSMHSPVGNGITISNLKVMQTPTMSQWVERSMGEFRRFFMHSMVHFRIRWMVNKKREMNNNISSRSRSKKIGAMWTWNANRIKMGRPFGAANTY